MQLFFKKQNKFFNIISVCFVLILIYFISGELYFENCLFNLQGGVYFFYLLFLIIIYTFPVLIFWFLKSMGFLSGFIKYIFYIFSSLYYILLLFLVLYLGRFKLVFDWHFFIFNINETIITTIKSIGLINFCLILIFFLFLVFSMIIFFKSIEILVERDRKSRRRKVLFLILTLFFSLLFGFKMGSKNPVLIKFLIRTWATNKEFIKDYDYKYQQIFDYYSSIVLKDFKINKSIEDQPDIYFIHLESVNSELVNEQITPELIKYADNYGVRFTNFFSNTVQTLRAEESILCAMPPSLNGYLQNTYDIQKIICLPKIFNHWGYKTMFFKSHSLEYTRTGDFMSKIGFSEIHNGDIMQENDAELEWGYKEDVFYDRVLEYIEKDPSPNKFVYVAVSSTNHYPFDVNHFDGDLPFMVEKKTTKDNLITKLSNSVYIQDNYFGRLMEKLLQDKKEKYIFIYSDNAWPVGIHQDNILNEANAFKENFSIPMAFIAVGDDNFKKGELVDNYYSQIDVFNTVLDLFGIDNSKKYLGNSFYNNLLKEESEDNVFYNADNCILNIQPFSDKFFSFFKNNIHYIYNIYTQDFVFYDLSKDINEFYPKQSNDFGKIYNECVNFNLNN